jgi:hypothetical protein
MLLLDNEIDLPYFIEIKEGTISLKDSFREAGR